MVVSPTWSLASNNNKRVSSALDADTLPASLVHISLPLHVTQRRQLFLLRGICDAQSQANIPTHTERASRCVNDLRYNHSPIIK